MHIIGGEKRLKEISPESHFCPACGGSGQGETLVDPWGTPWNTPCGNCGGWGDDRAWREFLDDFNAKLQLPVYF